MQLVRVEARKSCLIWSRWHLPCSCSGPRNAGAKCMIMRLSSSLHYTFPHNICRHTSTSASGVGPSGHEDVGQAGVGRPEEAWRAHWAAIERMRRIPTLRAPVDTLGATALAYGAQSAFGSAAEAAEAVEAAGGSDAAATAAAAADKNSTISTGTKADNTGAVAWQAISAAAPRGPKQREAFRFGTLVATMLSPQTRDKQTAKAFGNLQSLALAPVQAREQQQQQRGKRSGAAFNFTAAALARCSLEDITQACTPVSFYKTKAANILAACERIVGSGYCTLHTDGTSGEQTEEPAGIPTDIEDILSYRGVGPKIAYLTFSIAWGLDEGICVDTHVHRIANRLRWVGSPAPVTVAVAVKGKSDKKGKGKAVAAPAAAAAAAASDITSADAGAGATDQDQASTDTALQVLKWKPTASPEKSRLQLQQLLPRSHWGDANELLVGFGQTLCNAKKPLCGMCELRAAGCGHYAYAEKVKVEGE